MRASGLSTSLGGIPRRASPLKMHEVTYHLALPFVFPDDGIAAGEAAECLSAKRRGDASRGAARKPGHAGAIAFSRTDDPSSGDFSDAKLIRKFGDARRS
jgi:hypothetical protein